MKNGLIIVSYLTRARRLLWMAPAKWNRACTSMPSGTLGEVARTLSTIAIAAARASEYAEARHDGQDHAGAVRASNRRVARVRRALGYTYARQDLTF